ncbi:MAG: hypothetical protein AB1500_01265 [Bacillota bacterium]
MKTVHRLCIVLAVVMLIATTYLGSACAANKEKPHGKPGTVQPEWIYSGNFYFSPDTVSRNQYTYPYGELFGYSPFTADAKFEMLIDPNLNQPAVVSQTNLPAYAFRYEYVPAWGGNCWHYNSGVLWYSGNREWNLTARTYGTISGYYDGACGSDYYIPDLWYINVLHITL